MPGCHPEKKVPSGDWMPMLLSIARVGRVNMGVTTGCAKRAPAPIHIANRQDSAVRTDTATKHAFHVR